MVPNEKPAKAKTQALVRLALNAASFVDVLGDDPVLLRAGESREFTRAEADALLALRDPHGTPIVLIDKESPRG